MDFATFQLVLRREGKAMKQLLVALCLSLVSFAVTSVIFHNELVAGLVAVVILFLVFFGLCLLAMARYNEERDYQDKLKSGGKKAVT
jgi:di/tricarboxylate transporter